MLRSTSIQKQSVMRKPTLHLVLPFLLATSAQLAQASDLVSVYEATTSHDPAWQAKEYEYRATKQSKGIARAGLLPIITASGNRKETTDTRKNEAPEEYRSTTKQIQLTQPLFNLESWYAYKANAYKTEKAELDFIEAKQEHIYNTAVIYFDVLKAQEDLYLANAEEMVLKNQLEIIRHKANAGIVTQTDVLETQAAFDLSRVNQITVEGMLQYRKEILSTHSGLINVELSQLKADFDPIHVDPLNEAHWVEQAQAKSPKLKALKLSSNIAKHTYRKQKVSALPKIEFIASYSEADFEGGAFKPSGESESYGIQISAPIFAGLGDFYASKEQKMKQLQKNEENEAEKQSHAQLTQLRFRTLYTDVLRAKAYRTSVQSLEKALSAVKAEHANGSRDLSDVLSAQKQLFAAKKDMAHSRYDYILDRLLLEQAIGDLDEKDIEKYNNWLE